MCKLALKIEIEVRNVFKCKIKCVFHKMTYSFIVHPVRVMLIQLSFHEFYKLQNKMNKKEEKKCFFSEKLAVSFTK